MRSCESKTDSFGTSIGVGLSRRARAMARFGGWVEVVVVVVVVVS
jgi:hypothetical protein